MILTTWCRGLSHALCEVIRCNPRSLEKFCRHLLCLHAQHRSQASCVGSNARFGCLVPFSCRSGGYVYSISWRTLAAGVLGQTPSNLNELHKVNVDPAQAPALMPKVAKGEAETRKGRLFLFTPTMTKPLEQTQSRLTSFEALCRIAASWKPSCKGKQGIVWLGPIIPAVVSQVPAGKPTIA